MLFLCVTAVNERSDSDFIQNWCFWVLWLNIWLIFTNGCAIFEILSLLNHTHHQMSTLCHLQIRNSLRFTFFQFTLCIILLRKNYGANKIIDTKFTQHIVSDLYMVCLPMTSATDHDHNKSEKEKKNHNLIWARSVRRWSNKMSYLCNLSDFERPYEEVKKKIKGNWIIAYVRMVVCVYVLNVYVHK